METDLPVAPSVVSVMVVHEPGNWFDDTLAALAAQDYPNLRTLFLVTPVGSSRVDLQACKLEYSIVSPK